MHAYSNSLQYHTVKPQTSLICNLIFLSNIIQSKALQTKHVHKIQLFWQTAYLIFVNIIANEVEIAKISLNH